MIREQRRMVELLNGLGSAEGARPSILPGLTLLRRTHRVPPVPVLFEPCIVFVAEGVKRFHLPDRVVAYDLNKYLLLTVPAPADCETEPSADGPFLGVAVRIELASLAELLTHMEGAVLEQSRRKSDEWVCAPPMEAALADTVIRLLETLSSPIDTKVLGPQLIRELVYRVLSGKYGWSLRDLLRKNNSRSLIHRVLHRMHTDYALPLEVASLARDAGMSTSALFFHFKAVTGTSPVQYLKVIRLHKARALMVQDSLSAASAAQLVGYDSQSQFSREFKRMFGAPPAKEAYRVRATSGMSV